MAAETDALAQVYARSLYELAERAGGREKIFEIGGELEDVCELARSDRRFAEFLASPVVSTRPIEGSAYLLCGPTSRK